jgi:hypothetical protein
MIAHVKKMYGGRTSVRDYLVKYCKKMREPLIIDFENKQMRVKDLNKYYCDQIPHHAQLTDKYIRKGEVYYLWDYLFEPNIEATPPTEYTETGLKGLLQAWKNLKKPKQMPIDLDNK